MLKHLCPCCGRHCNLEQPNCDRGREYEKSGLVPPYARDAEGEREGDGLSEQERRYHMLDQDNKLIWNIRDMGQVIVSLAEGKASQNRILIILHEVGVITQRELTERLDVQPGSASEVIGKLENAGLIARVPSEKDRRTSDIRLTEVGKIKAVEAAAQRKERHTEMFSCLSEEDKADLLMLLEKVNYAWRHRSSERSKE